VGKQICQRRYNLSHIQTTFWLYKVPSRCAILGLLTQLIARVLDKQKKHENTIMQSQHLGTFTAVCKTSPPPTQIQTQQGGMYLSVNPSGLCHIGQLQTATLQPRLNSNQGLPNALSKSTYYGLFLVCLWPNAIHRLIHYF
jgi:hypothetical protein